MLKRLEEVLTRLDMSEVRSCSCGYMFLTEDIPECPICNPLMETAATMCYYYTDDGGCAACGDPCIDKQKKYPDCGVINS